MVGQGGVVVCDIKYVDRSTSEHEVHPSGSVGGVGQRGTGHGGPKGAFRTRSKP